MTTPRLQYGLNLIHFGKQAQPESILRSARLAEHYGFDSVFVRDHVAYRPRKMEKAEPDYLDAFVTLSAVAAVTKEIVLGMAVLNPHRHPIHEAQLLGSLARLAGAHRVFPMWGLGGDREFEAIGLAAADRPRLLVEHIEIIRALWTGKRIDHTGEYYSFTDVDCHPVPEGGPLPMWYGGSSVAGVRRAVETFDGWSAGHIPGRDYRRLRRRMLAMCEERGRAPLPSCISPLVSPGRSVEEAVAKVSLEKVIEDFSQPRKRFTLPESGRFQTLEDLDGGVIAGPASEIAAGVRKHQQAGVDLVIFDMRQRADDLEECIAMIGEEVLPVLHREDGRPPRGSRKGV
jgi:alkanesulfonate monooxygenase SsuD/methylene tetrahydromethanopterin reductase-like flavin-dependent oxidoreductase (luciferase family)